MGLVKKVKTIGLIASTTSECRSLVRNLRLSRMKTAPASLHIYRGRHYDRDIMCVISGIGKTNASHAATWLIREHHPQVLINFGVGGAYPFSGLNVGDLAVATKEVYADEGVLLNSGFRQVREIGIPFLKVRGRTYFNEFPLNRKLGVAALLAARVIAPAQEGIFTTVSACTGTDKRSKELSERYEAICENMEGAAIAHICLLYGISCVEIRGISNIVEKRDVSKWNIPHASDICQRAVLELINVLQD